MLTLSLLNAACKRNKEVQALLPHYRDRCMQTQQGSAGAASSVPGSLRHQNVTRTILERSRFRVVVRVRALRFVQRTGVYYIEETPINTLLNSSRSDTVGFETMPSLGWPLIHIAVDPPWSISL
jgi:hypothetical protein